MKKLILYTVLFVVGMYSSGLPAATPLNSILQTIEKNNLDLKSAREEAKIRKMDTRIEGNLDDPEIEYEYLWGNKANGYQDNQVFSIKQAFDFPTVYYHRNKVVSAKDSLAVLDYMSKRQNVLLDAKVLLIELICLRKQQNFQNQRYEHAVSMQKLYEKKLKEGASTLIDVNKIKLELLNSKASFQFYKMAMETTLKKMEAMNGNEPLDLTSLEYDRVIIPADFESYYLQAESRNAELRALDKEREISKKEISLAKSMAFPKLSIGYQTEITGNEKLRGVVAGVSIPLWSNRNKVKRSKNQMILSNLTFDNARINFRNEILQLYQNVKYQQELCNEYESLDLDGKMKLLEKSLNAGQISLLEYFNELIILFDSYKTSLELERDFQVSYAQMMKFII